MTESRRRFAADRSTVFDRLVDAECYPAWLGGARRIEIRDPQWPAPDTSFDHEVGVGPVRVHDSTTVEDVDEGRSLHLVVRARPFLVADVWFEVRAVDGGSEVVMREEPRGSFRLVAALIAPAVRLRNDRSLARLDRLLRAQGAR